MKYSELSSDSMAALPNGKTGKSGYKSEKLVVGGKCKNKLYLFKDEYSHIHLAIELSTKNAAKGVNDPNIQGFKMSTNEFILEANGSKSWYLNLSCTDDRMVSIFLALVKGICKDLESSTLEFKVTINNVIRSWKSFWSPDRLGALSDQALIGLFAELVVLKDLASRNGLIALDSWKGPVKEKHDFLLNEVSLEIKATTSNKKTYAIHGLDQLAPFPDRKLYLITASVKIINSPKATSLVDLIDQILILLKGDQEAEDRFRSLLAQSGYSPIFNESLQHRKIEVMNSLIYEVDNGFPALTSNSIDSSIQPVISNVQYDLSLAGVKGDTYEPKFIKKLI